MSVASDDVGFARHCFANLFLLEKISRKAVRSHGPHVGGIYKSDRLFGGQSAAQFQLAFRRLFPRIVVQTLRVNYVAPGNLDDPIDYFFDPLPGTAFMMGRAVQKERIIASANIRYGPPNDLLDQSPYFMPSLRSPLSYGSVRERSLFLEDEAAKRTLQNLP
uniref:Catalase domain-containing protein n=1 Tax=Steinernema glaseri TaxID=37863 RepID=A0A1I7Z5M1_9BILA